MIAFQNPLLPPAASTFAPAVDGVYLLTLWICGAFFVLITALLAYSVLKWRRRSPSQEPASLMTHHTGLEVTWTLVPLVIMMVLFAMGWKGSSDMTVAPADCLQYEAVGRQWEWQITHPDSKSPSIREMWVPVNRNVKVRLWSNDVLHAFFVPAFRVKRDVIPGRYQLVWFNATQIGDFPILCAEYCGTNHSYMRGTVHVVSEEEFAKRPWDLMPSDPPELGKWLYDRRCTACHSIEPNKRMVGPSFHGLWGKEESLDDGTKVVVDEAYIRESIKNPSAKTVATYQKGAMSMFPDITDTQIDGFIAYLKTLK